MCVFNGKLASGHITETVRDAAYVLLLY